MQTKHTHTNMPAHKHTLNLTVASQLLEVSFFVFLIGYAIWSLKGERMTFKPLKLKKKRNRKSNTDAHTRTL